MTSRLCLTAPPSPETDKYATLVAEALLAFERDVMYAIQVAESARAILGKGKKSKSVRS